ncbi:MAG: SDR family oxidoreductase [bacterium]
MGQLDGRVALVTGATAKRGFGHATALRLAGEGADIVLVDKEERLPSLFTGDEEWGGLPEIVSEIKSLGKAAISVRADVTSSRDVASAVEKAVAKFGRIDILVNCAGHPGKRETHIVKLGLVDWKTVLNVNLTGSFLVSRSVVRDMLRRGEGGAIVHLSSMRGKAGGIGNAGYVASKFGVIGLVQSMALEFAAANIRVNAICPGFFITNFRDQWSEERGRALGISTDEARNQCYEEWRKTVPLRRIGTPEDVANLALFLVSDQSSYMTGQAISLDGGLLMS